MFIKILFLKAAPHLSFRKVPTGWLRDREERMEELNGNRLRLIPGLCIGDKTN